MSQPEENTRAALTPNGASDRDRIAQAVEREIERLRKLRPELDSRIDRAASILVMQLSSRPRSLLVRVRISKDGTAKFLVASATVGGGVYVVDPKRWECNCPDAHRRLGKGCKHSITCYVLARVARVPKKGCSACHGGWVYIGEEIVDPESGEIAEAINPVRCWRCGDGFSHSYVQRWLESQRWVYARSRPSNPHEYCLRGETGDEATFERIVEHIRELGYPYPWWGAVYRQYVAGDFAYWTMGSPPHQTQLINRKTLEQVRLDQLTNKGGGGIVWPWLHKDVEAERAEVREQQDYCSEGGRCRIQIYEESGKSSLEHPRMRSDVGRLGGTSPSRYPNSLRGEDDQEAG